jgi:hypothetical protein
MRIASLPVLLFLSNDLVAQQQTLADRVADDTLLYLSLDTRRLVDGALDLDLVKLLDEEQVQTFVAPLAGKVPVGLSSQGLRQALDSVPWRDYVNGRVEIALRGVEVKLGETVVAIHPSHPIDARSVHALLGMAAQLESGESNDLGAMEVSPDLVACVDVGPRFGQWYDDLLKGVAEHGHTLRVEKCTIGGHAASRLQIGSGGRAPSATLHVANDQGRWWLAGSAASLERALAGAQGGSSLAGSPAFRKCVDQVASKDPTLLAYFNVAHVGRLVERFVPPIMKEELDLLGLSAVESIGLASSYVEGGVRDSVALTWSQPPTGLLSLLDCTDGGFDYLSAAPVETGFYLGLRVAPEAFFDKALAVAEQLAPGAGGRLEQALAKLDEEFVRESGLSLRDSLLPALGDEIGVWLTPPGAGAVMPDGMVMIEVGDRQQFEKLFAKLREQLTAEGTTLNEARGLPAGMSGFTMTIPGAPVQPALAITDSALCIAPNVLALKSSLKAIEKGRETCARDNPRMQRVLTGLTGKPTADGLSFLAFVDLQKLVEIGYQFAPMASGPMQEATDGAIDMAALPESEVVARHFSGIGIAGRSDGHGLMFSMFTPTGLLPMAGAGAATMLMRHERVVISEPAVARAAPAELGKPAATEPAPAGGKTRSLATLFANLEKATGATIDYPDSIADVPVNYSPRSGDLDTILADLAKLVGFDYDVRVVDGEKVVSITKG